ncbi:hypothetical protein J19TS1_41300 [Heyndrickxia oleronia]|nr:hypothetical protein J19TS1_41300 [Heyndrickxia oleronia]
MLIPTLSSVETLSNRKNEKVLRLFLESSSTDNVIIAAWGGQPRY